MTNRRGFLAAMAAAFVVDPEKLLWRPGAKTFSIPKLSMAVDMASGDSETVVVITHIDFVKGIVYMESVSYNPHSKIGVGLSPYSVIDPGSSGRVYTLEGSGTLSPRHPQGR